MGMHIFLKREQKPIVYEWKNETEQNKYLYKTNHIVYVIFILQTIVTVYEKKSVASLSLFSCALPLSTAPNTTTMPILGTAFPEFT